jgi:penicillin-binding protein 1A
MKGALADAPATPFRIAPGIEEVPVDWKSGVPVPPGTPGAIMEAFKAGTAFAETSMPVLGEEYAPTPTSSASQPPPASVGSGTGGLY